MPTPASTYTLDTRYARAPGGRAVPLGRSYDFGNIMPTDANTGVLRPVPSAPATNYPNWNPTTTDSTVITVDGTTIESVTVWGQLVIKAKDVTVRDCILRGVRNFPTNYTAIIDCTDVACTNALIEDSTFVPQLPNFRQAGMRGINYTARRNRLIWCSDSFDVFSSTPDIFRSIKVVLEGNKGSDNCYWHSTVPQFTAQNTGSFTMTTIWGDSYTVTAMPNNTDGTHNDFCQIQGGRGGPSTFRATGNYVSENLAQNGVHPLGWSETVPPVLGQPNDCPRRYVATSNGATLNPMQNGQYSGLGQGFVIEWSAGLSNWPDQRSIVIEYNWINACGQGISINSDTSSQPAAPTAITATLRGNRFGESWYVYGSNPTTSPNIYPIRSTFRAGTNVMGLLTTDPYPSTWFEGHWQTVGSYLQELSGTPGRTSGIQYDG